MSTPNTYNLTPAMLHWLNSGERGLSSDAIFMHLTGFPANGGRTWAINYPSDPDDLRRCILLLEQVPEFAPRISEMSFVSPVWAALSSQWDLLVQELKEEAAAFPGGWKGRHWSCPRTYEHMRLLINEARGIAA